MNILTAITEFPASPRVNGALAIARGTRVPTAAAMAADGGVLGSDATGGKAWSPPV